MLLLIVESNIEKIEGEGYIMSSLSSNETAVDSMTRASYYAAQQQYQLQQQRAAAAAIYNSSNIASTVGHSGGANFNNSYHLSNNNTLHQPSAQHHQHPTVFQIYNDSSNYMQQQHYIMSAGNGALNSASSMPGTPTSMLSTSALNQSAYQTSGGATSIGGSSSSSSVQKQIQQDWTNREYIEVILSNIKKLTDFLNSFDLSCKSKMAIMDEKLTKLEKQIDFIEAQVTKGDALN